MAQLGFTARVVDPNEPILGEKRYYPPSQICSDRVCSGNFFDRVPLAIFQVLEHIIEDSHTNRHASIAQDYV